MRKNNTEQDDQSENTEHNDQSENTEQNDQGEQDEQSSGTPVERSENAEDQQGAATEDAVFMQSESRLDSMLGFTMAKQPKSRRVRLFGLIVMLCFFGGFSTWSYFAPIESAAAAPGKIVVTGNRRTIQHLEGGIIKKIYVKDGTVVKKGEVLIQLEDTRAITSLSITDSEINQLGVMESRLLAERDNRSQVVFDKNLLKASKQEPKLVQLMRAQRDIFRANTDSFKGNIEILKQQIKQLYDQMRGVHAQLVANTKQFELIKEEIVSVKELARQRLIEKPRLLELQRNAARLQGGRGENVANISLIKQQVGETRTKILTAVADRRKDILTQLRETQQRLSDLRKQAVVEKDVLSRTQVRSPQNGSVVGLAVHTIGGVIQPGEALMDIVPDEQLIIDARISPLDIDIVHKGLLAKVTLSAFKSRGTPMLEGRVESVSADSFQDPQTGEPYYQAKIELSQSELDRLEKGQKLYPGMPVQVMIVVDKRSMFQYLIAPIKESFNRSFREQ